MDNGTIVLEILRNLSDDDVYDLIDVFENHNDDEECMKRFNKVVNKIQNVVNKLDSNFLTNFKDKHELAYFMYDMAMDYHSNDLTQEKIDEKLDFFRKNKISESTNKYIKIFREAIEKLEEAPINSISKDNYRIKNINQELAINKAIDRISNVFTETSTRLNDGSEWKFKPIELIGDDNSGGYWVTTELLGFVNFYNTLSDENKKSLENKLYKKLNLTINKIEDLVNNPNDGGDWTPEYAKQWINSLYESVKTNSTNKYVLAFRESCRKLEEKQNFSNSHWDEIPPEKHTEKQLNAINEFDNLVKQVQEGLITRKEFIQRADILYNDLPDFDWTRDSDAKLPNELFPNDNKVKNTNPSIQEILDGNYEINS